MEIRNWGGKPNKTLAVTRASQKPCNLTEEKAKGSNGGGRADQNSWRKKNGGQGGVQSKIRIRHPENGYQVKKRRTVSEKSKQTEQDDVNARQKSAG